MAEPSAKRRRLGSLQSDEVSVEDNRARGSRESSNEDNVDSGRKKRPTPVHNSHYGLVQANGNARVQNGDAIHHHYHGTAVTNNGPNADDQAYIDLKESLTFERMDARMRNISTALPQTCKWLFKHKQFVSWNNPSDLQRHKGYLWIKGKPGCGKSTIMKAALIWAAKSLPGGFISISYFFNARAPDSLEKSSFGLYRSMVNQLLDSIPSLRASFMTTFASKYNSSTREVEAWTEHEIREYLIAIVRDTTRPPICAFVDALDEGVEEDIRSMISFLEELSMHADECGTVLRICLSSRHYPHITIRHGLSLTVEDQLEHDVDIERYVEKKLVRILHPRLVELRAEICRKAAGIFLWVVLVVPMLNSIYDHGGPFDEVMDRLNNIPQGLEGLFAEILQQAPNETPLCVSLLQWVLFATRALSPTELYLAVHCTETSRGILITVPDVADVSSVARFILTFSHGLVEETKAQPPKIQFIHESVREFLLGSKGLTLVDQTLQGNITGFGNHNLSKACLQYARSLLPQSVYDPTTSHCAVAVWLAKMAPEEHPFLAYATTNVFRHAEAAAACGVPERNSVIDMLRSGDFKNWKRLRNHHEKFTVRMYDDDVTMCYFLAEQGFAYLLRAHPSLYRDVNHPGGRYGTALQAASFAGHREIVKLLIHNRANINIENGEYGHPLVAAILGKHFDIAQLLYDKGARLNETLLKRTFMKSIARGSEGAVALLINMGADIRWKNSRKESVFYMATIKRHAKVLKILLERKALRGDPITELDNALCLAARHGDVKIVDLVLSMGATKVVTAFWDAVTRDAVTGDGHAVVDRLLSADADACLKYRWPTSVIGEDYDVLQMAVYRGKPEVVKALTQHELAMGILRPGLGLALYLATSCKMDELDSMVESRLEIVRILLENGADANFCRSVCDSALSVAVRKGRAEVVRILLDHGAVFEKHDKCAKRYPSEKTLLNIAIVADDTEVVELLFKHGADIHGYARHELPPLVLAASKGNITIVSILIDNGADLNATNKIQPDQTALFQAVIHGYDEIAKLLIDRGARISIRDGKIAVTRAVHQNDLTLITQMLKKGAELESHNQISDAMLHSAIRHGESGLPILKFLLENGVVPNVDQLLVAHEENNFKAYSVMKPYMLDDEAANSVSDVLDQHATDHYSHPLWGLAPDGCPADTWDYPVLPNFEQA